MPEQEFDLIVIGAGPGGYICALRAAQLGLRTALVEKDAVLGGTCLQVGCIPSKALLHATELHHRIRHEGPALGLRVESLCVDLPAMMRRKDAVVSQLSRGIDTLVSRRGVHRVRGMATLAGPGIVRIVPPTPAEAFTLRAPHIVLATGSVPVELPGLPYDGQAVVSSEQALSFDRVPRSLAVVGAGAIGLELGCVWARLGAEVTVVELLPRIAPGMDDDVGSTLHRILLRQGLKFELGARVTEHKVLPEGRSVLVAEREGKAFTIPAERVLVAVGRTPRTAGLGLEERGIRMEGRRIAVDGQFRSSLAGVFAIGDLVAGPMLAHKAEEEGVAVAEIIAGKPGRVNHAVIPGVIYTSPEAAGVGLTEAQARERGLDIRCGRFPLSANGRAIACVDTEGFAKVIADARTDRLLGVHIVARHASELIAEAVAHLEYGGSAEDIARTVHAHPTTSEALKEAALAVSRSALHALG